MGTCNFEKFIFVNHWSAQFNNTVTHSKNGFERLFLAAISSLIISCGLWGVDLTYKSCHQIISTGKVRNITGSWSKKIIMSYLQTIYNIQYMGFGINSFSSKTKTSGPTFQRIWKHRFTNYYFLAKPIMINQFAYQTCCIS